MTPWSRPNYYTTYSTQFIVSCPSESRYVVWQVREYFFVLNYDQLRPVTDALIGLE